MKVIIYCKFSVKNKIFNTKRYAAFERSFENDIYNLCWLQEKHTCKSFCYDIVYLLKTGANKTWTDETPYCMYMKYSRSNKIFNLKLK
jgi:hypothetical protein